MRRRQRVRRGPSSVCPLRSGSRRSPPSGVASDSIVPNIRIKFLLKSRVYEDFWLGSFGTHVTTCLVLPEKTRRPRRFGEAVSSERSKAGAGGIEEIPVRRHRLRRPVDGRD